jgi:hypothetical protein
MTIIIIILGILNVITTIYVLSVIPKQLKKIRSNTVIIDKKIDSLK